MRLWEDFLRIWSRIGELQKFVLALSAAIAGFGALTPIVPPIDRATVGFLSAVMSLFSIAVVFLGYRRGQRRDAAAIRHLFVTFFIAILLYLLFHTALVFKSDVLQSQVVRGLWCNPEKAAKIQVLAGRCPLLSERDLQGNEFDLDFFWTPSAVLATKLLLLVVWFVLVAILSVGAARFALATQRPTKAKPKLDQGKN